MTRAEAVKILSRIWGGNPQHDLANSYADAFAALGLLKFEEPADPWTLFLDKFCQKFDYEDDDTDPQTCVHDIKQALRMAGLKIVHRSPQGTPDAP